MGYNGVSTKLKMITTADVPKAFQDIADIVSLKELESRESNENE